MTLRFGILGGAFNPPHFAHLRTALDAMDYLQLDQIIFVPAGGHPFKNWSQLAGVDHRLKMTQLAIAAENGFALSTIETDAAKISYTVDTLAVLKQQFADAQLYFLIGSDILAELHLWHDWQQILQFAHLAIMSRPNYNFLLSPPPAWQFLQPKQLNVLAHCWPFPGYGVFQVPVTPLDISSSYIRSLLQAGKSARFLLPDSVLDYIRQNNVYG